MTVHAHCSERIRLLREALERICYHANAYTMRAAAEANVALLADDALAATPPPDLPLAEGSRFSAGRDGATVVGGGCDSLSITNNGPSGRAILWLLDDDDRESSAWMDSVLALARREGLV